MISVYLSESSFSIAGNSWFYFLHSFSAESIHSHQQHHIHCLILPLHYFGASSFLRGKFDPKNNCCSISVKTFFVFINFIIVSGFALILSDAFVLTLSLKSHRKFCKFCFSLKIRNKIPQISKKVFLIWCNYSPPIFPIWLSETRK